MKLLICNHIGCGKEFEDESHLDGHLWSSHRTNQNGDLADARRDNLRDGVKRVGVDFVKGVVMGYGVANAFINPPRQWGLVTRGIIYGGIYYWIRKTLGLRQSELNNPFKWRHTK